jgi:multidrug efflux system membrane fusion protein
MEGARRRPAGAAALAVAAAAVAAAWVTAGCGGNTSGARGGPPPVPVVAGQVVRKTMPVTFKAIGNVEAIETVAVKARIGGELQRVWFEEGQRVRTGDTLVTIDQRPHRAALAQAEALLAHDQALLAKAEEDTRRYAGLVEKDFVTREQFAQINANAAALRAAVAADQARVDGAKLDLSFCTIVAPVAGRTGKLMVKTGALIKANDDKAIVTINQIDPIHVSFAVPARHLPAVLARRGEGIAVRAAIPHDAGPPAQGTLSFVDNAVDTATGTILLKAAFANRDERLWPGQFVDVTVVLGEEPDRVVCPAPAVQTGQQGAYVFVIADDDTVEMREVKVDRLDEHEAVIAAGLTGGETVVTDGQLRLVPGGKVVRRDGVPPAGNAS